ncbi:MAG: TldD/PmbA family protein [Desulfurococcaceae archaeon]
MNIDESTLQRIVDWGLEKGASYVEARYHDIDGFLVNTRNDKVIGISHEREYGVGIRVIVNGALGFSATSDLSIESLAKALESAISRARALSRLRRKPIEFADDKLGSVKYNVYEKKPILSHYTPIDARSLLIEIYKLANEAVRESKIPALIGFARSYYERKIILNSDGGRIESTIPRVYLSSMATLINQRGSIQRRIEFGASGGAEKIAEWNVLEKVQEELKAIENVLLKGVEPPSEKVTVVLSSEVVGLIVHESSGHPMEADRILGREAAQAGESYVKPEMIRKYRVGNEYANVVEDPTIPGSYGFYLYDEECVRARPRYLYREGLLYEPLHNRHTARLFGGYSNGAARAMNYASEPIIRMSNTYLAPGEMEFDELIEDVELGLYVKSYMEWNIDDARWNQRYVGLESYMIRNGELAEPVRNPVLEFTTGWFYSNIQGVDKNLKFYPGTCGKGEPSQGVPVWFGGPNVKLNKIRVGVLG